MKKIVQVWLRGMIPWVVMFFASLGTSAYGAVNVVNYGQHGEVVANIQRDLVTQGFQVGSIDGIYGPETWAAVRRFQQAHHLSVDGIVGPQTWRALAPGGPQTKTTESAYINYWNHEPTFVRGGKSVVLTFDDGPSPWTGTLIEILDKEKAPAVFFWNTYHIHYATNTVVTLLKHSPTIMVGDHTVDHPNLLNLGYERQYREIVDDKNLIEAKLGRTVYFFRPPYGNFNAITEQVLNKAHLKTVMWNVDSLDWKYGRNEPAILHEIKSQLHNGSIIIMHDHYYTIKLLPAIIAMIRRDGYRITTFKTPTFHGVIWHHPRLLP